jgi:hypothetical protein
VVDLQHERLYRFMRRVGLALLPFFALVGVVFGVAFGPIAGLASGLVAMSLGLYMIFGFSHVNEWLRSRNSPS